MEIATLFTEQKWNILKLLSMNGLSPLQLAEKSNTSIANISQQLRLLEAADLVKKEKIKNRDKGKPRSLFTLSEDYAFVASAMDGFADKKLLVATDYHNALIRILFLDNSNLQYYLSKLYWKIEDHLKDIDSMLLPRESISSEGDIQLLIVSKKGKDLEKRINIITLKNPEGVTRNIKISCISKEDLLKLEKSGKGIFSSGNEPYFIYDKIGLRKEIAPKKEVIND